jgi:hypothetical protein
MSDIKDTVYWLSRKIATDDQPKRVVLDHANISEDTTTLLTHLANLTPISPDEAVILREFLEQMRKQFGGDQ